MILPKAELKRQMKRYHEDPKKALSVAFLSELSGISAQHIRDVFFYDKEPLTEMVQIRMSRALARLAAGEVQIMQNRNNSRFMQYNKENKPRMVKSNEITFKNGQFGLKMGVKNANDYSQPTLAETLKRS